MDYYQSAKEEIKRVVDIVEMIGHFIQLKRAGQNHIGLCPFHSEKDPSFSVSPGKQMFHCFGCKKGGDIFDFWMEYHGTSFPQALTDLAERYHVPIPEKRSISSERRASTLKESLIAINQITGEYYHKVLTQSEQGRLGRAYFQGRSFSNEIIAQFMLGYAPDAWDRLTSFLQKKKVDMQKAVQAGLIIPKKNGGYYDRFRARVLFPIFDIKNQILGFGGRVLNDALPKYLNTPETPIFHKGELLYGLNMSYQFIRESGRAVIVEGYTDVLAMRLFGFNGAVATLGTALTKDHIRKLKGYAKEIVVVFDSDTAGKLAAIKSISIFLDEGVSAKVLVLPENEDPDSYVKEHGLNSFLDLLTQSRPIFDFFLDEKLSGIRDNLDGKIRVLEKILPVVSEVKNEAQRSLYVRRISEKMGISESALLSELQKRVRPSSKNNYNIALKERLSDSNVLIGDDLLLLNLLIHHPNAMAKLMDHDYKVLLSDPTVIEIFDTMVEIYHREGKISPTDILAQLMGDSTKAKFREVMLMSPIYRDDEVEQAAKEFEDRVHKIRISHSKKRALERGNLEELNKIPEMIKKRWG